MRIVTHTGTVNCQNQFQKAGGPCLGPRSSELLCPCGSRWLHMAVSVILNQDEDFSYSLLLSVLQALLPSLQLMATLLQ